MNNINRFLMRLTESKLFFIACPAAFIIFNIFIFGPATIYGANNSEFGFDLASLLSNFIIPMTIIFAVILLPGLFLAKKLLNIYVSLLFALGLLLWLQGNILVWNYGLFDGVGIAWDRYKWHAFLDTSLWLIFCILAIIFHRRITKISSFASLFFILFLSINLFLTHFMDPNIFKTKFPVVQNTPSSLFNYSSSLNIIHFIFDGFQTDIFEEIVKENEMESKLDGFVLFRDNITVSGYTVLSTSSIFSGEKIPEGTQVSKFYKEAFSTKGFHNKLFNNDFVVNLVPAINMPTESYTNYYRVPRAYGGSREEIIISESALLADLSLFRHAPHFIKKLVYNDQRWALQPLLRMGKKSRLGFIHQLDFFKDYLVSIKLADSRPAYHFMHIVMPHLPFVIKENGEYVNGTLPPTVANYKIQARHLIETFLNFLEHLKALGVYDSSLIILQADHGLEQVHIEMEDKPVDTGPSNPKVARSLALLTVKAPHAIGALITSVGETSTIDVAPTIMKFAGLQNDFGGIPVFDINLSKVREREFENFIVKGKARRYASWEQKLQVPPTDLEAPVYQWGSVIDFSLLGNAEPYLTDGWSEKEENHIWTNKKSASLTIQIVEPESAIVFKAIFMTYISKGKLEEQNVTILVNGVKVDEWVLTSRGVQERTFIIPKKLIKNPMNITFKLPDAKSPYQLNGSTDTRLLGIGLQKLILSKSEP